MLIQKLTEKQTSIIQAGVLISVLVLMERYSPIRQPREQKRQRIVRNLAIAGLGLVIQAIEKPLINRALSVTKKHNLGLLNQWRLPSYLRVSLGVMMLDYTLYWWHYLNHRSRFLWRFHEIHHADMDMDFSTANRFHFGELFLSFFWRLSQITVLGIDHVSLSLWQNLLSYSILFHHSNLKLPALCEKFLQPVIVTPNIHAIHHSKIKSDSNTNFSSGLSLWDRLHRTFRSPKPNENLIMGTADLQEVGDAELAQMLSRPFKRRG